MENNRFNKAIQDIKSISMSAAEKQTMKASILAGSTTYAPTYKTPIKSYWSVYSFSHWIGTHRILSSVVVLIIIIIGSNALVVASQNALPGDALYSMKLNLTEPTQLALISDPVQKAEVQTELLQNRFTEVETLAVQGKLDPTVQESTDLQVQKQVNDINSNLKAIAKVSADKADDVDSTVVASIRVHDRVIAEINNRRNGSITSGASLARAAKVAPTTVTPSVVVMSASAPAATSIRSLGNKVVVAPVGSSIVISTSTASTTPRIHLNSEGGSRSQEFEQKVQKKEAELFKKAQQRLNKERKHEEIGGDN